MSLKARIDADHNTLTNMVNVVGNAKREIQQHLSEQDQRLGRIEQKVDSNQQENRERFDKIEDTLAIIVNHLKK